MKHLEIEVSRYETLVFGRVVAQSHRGSEFGVDGADEFAHAGFTLYSRNTPALLSNALYVRGYDSGTDDWVFSARFITIDAAKACIAAMKACVAAYLRESNGETPCPVATIKIERIGG